jgi:hypothetical protein
MSADNKELPRHIKNVSAVGISGQGHTVLNVKCIPLIILKGE